jgi:hypothetical protein
MAAEEKKMPLLENKILLHFHKRKKSSSYSNTIIAPAFKLMMREIERENLRHCTMIIIKASV